MSKINLLKKCLNELRDMRKYTIKSDDLGEEQLYYLQEGFREGLCAAALILAEEFDAELINDENYPEIYGEDNYISMVEENWWHTHTDENGDIGTDERYDID